MKGRNKGNKIDINMSKVIKERGGDIKAKRKRWTVKEINNLTRSSGKN
jgi:hypothetical protein